MPLDEISWTPQYVIVIADHPEGDRLTDPLEGHAVVEVNSGFPEPLGAFDPLDLQRWVAGALAEE